MFYLPVASAASIAVDVALAFSGFFVGCGVALVYARFAAPRAARSDQPPPTPAKNDAESNEAARTNMAAQQLRDLAKNVASDVGAHNLLVEDIAGQLGALQGNEPGNGAVVMDAVAKMLEANKKLSHRLEDAEQKIQAQAAEIRVQQSEARTDALTQLANRRAFDACLQESIERFDQAGSAFSMLLLDVDHFKKFNDEHGHLAGDEVLKRVGQTLKGVVKSGDLPCRYGGEEFAVVLANTKLAEGRIAAERVRQAIEAMAVDFNGKSLRVTASVGLAACQQGDDATRLVRRADDAVYASKEAGRNCSHWSDGEANVLIAKELDAAAKPKKPAAPQPVADDLPSRAVFTDELHRRIAEGHRSGAPVAVLHYRVKDYANIENAYGIGVGELLLDALAIFIRSTLRDMDLLGKLDPGDFVVMLPGTTCSAAKIVGQRVKSSISLCPIPLGDEQIRLELDMGVAAAEASDDAASLMAHALVDMEKSAALEDAEVPGLSPA